MLLELTALAALVILLLGYCAHRHQYWQSRGVFVPPMLPVLGHVLTIFSVKQNRFEFLHKVLKQIKAPYFGLYEILQPSLVVRDNTLLKNILVKDFDHFVDRRRIEFSPVDSDIQDMLGNLSGEKWKTMRSTISPAFTSGKLKSLFPLLEAKCKILTDWCLENGDERNMEMKNVFGRFTIDGIATCAFGIESNCIENENDEFAKTVIKGFEPPGWLTSLKFQVCDSAPWLSRRLNISILNSYIHTLIKIARMSLDVRKTSGRRGDFLDLMLEAKQEDERDSDKNKYHVTDATIVAQSVEFIFAGYETSSTALAFLSHLLAKHPEAQTKLREELRNLVDTHEKLTYQAIMEAKFLDACIHECLRLYPPLPFTERICTKDYLIPGTDLLLKKGTVVVIPVWSLNRDPETWEDPEAFNPERFCPENRTPEKVFAFHSFGQGPRNCIGMRFALLEVKMAIAHLVLSMELLPPFGHDEPFEFVPNPQGLLSVKDGIHLTVRPLPD